MPREIPKAYEPQEIEERWAKAWFEEKLFRAENSGDGPMFSIALPPPNITGSIHIGHMLEHTQIDMLVRWHRMRGHHTLWLPGMDHAGIATQFVVERQLAKEKIRRQDLGREEFERRVWKWKAESGGVIKEQMIRLGASCDWTREKFTLEPALYRAVLEAFLRLYRERPDLSRPLHGELVPALPDGHQRPGSGPQRAARKALAHPLSDRWSRCGRKQVSRRGHDAAGNDAGRYGRRRSSGR